MGWRRDHFSGLGKLEGDVQLCVTSRERLQSKTCLSALLPEISHMGKLVLGESVGSGGPRSLRGHGRTPAGIRTSARWPSEDFHRQSQTLRGGLSTRPFYNLLRSVIKLCKLGRCDKRFIKLCNNFVCIKQFSNEQELFIKHFVIL